MHFSTWQCSRAVVAAPRNISQKKINGGARLWGVWSGRLMVDYYSCDTL